VFFSNHFINIIWKELLESCFKCNHGKKQPHSEGEQPGTLLASCAYGLAPSSQPGARAGTAPFSHRIRTQDALRQRVFAQAFVDTRASPNGVGLAAGVHHQRMARSKEPGTEKLRGAETIQSIRKIKKKSPLRKRPHDVDVFLNLLGVKSDMSYDREDYCTAGKICNSGAFKKENLGGVERWAGTVTNDDELYAVWQI
jgi:hypothetical protein